MSSITTLDWRYSYNHMSFFIVKEFECLKEALKADRTNAFGMLQCAHAFVHCKHHFVLVMEPLQACDVFDPSNSDSADGKCPRHIAQLIQNISLSLNLLHIRLGRIHADLKPENILISRHERRFRLIDYGSTVPKSQASVYETKEAGFELVSWMYRAPELLIGLSGGVAPAIDIWSLGCLAFEALVGRSLCQSTDRMQFLKSLSEILGPLPEVYKTGQYFTSALSTCLSSAYENGSDKNYWRRWRAANLRSILNIKDTVFLDLMSRLLDPDPSNRISVEEIIRHPFVSPMTPFFDKPMHDLPIVHAPLEFCMSPSKENQRPENKAMKKAPAPRKKKQEETIPSPIASEQSVSETTKVSVPTLKKAATSKAAKEAVSRAPARKPDAPTSSVSPLEIEFTQLPSTETIPKDPVLKAMTRRVPQVTGKRRTRV